MRIKLLVSLPVEPKHGMIEGLVIDAKKNPGKAGRNSPEWFVISPATGEKIGVLFREAESFTQSTEPPLAVDLPCVCQRFDNGTKVFPNQICDGCRNSASH